ncbi:MAG: hypothetical protein EOP07_22140, partial [Proteobacteria bacterium]
MFKRREGSAYNRSPIMGEGLRILRLAESLRLAPETLERIKNKLFGETGQSVSKVEASQVTIERPSEYPSRYPEVERIDDAEIERLTKAFAKTQSDVQRPGATVIKPVLPAAPQAELKAAAPQPELKVAAPAPVAAAPAIKADAIAQQMKATLAAAIPEIKAEAVKTEPKLTPHSHSYAAAQEETKKAIDAAIAARKATPVSPQKSAVDDFVEAEILLRKKIEGVQN